ncbi:MAG: hypothetical protein KF745_11955 [Phycisphaeraceae bacterium]|nr:hypothetical protein [Phycisphaeraceae bacterium]
MSEDTTGRADDAIREIRRHHEGVLIFDGHAAPVRYVVCGRSGALILACEPVALHATDHILSIPDESDGALAVMLQLDPIDPRSGPAAESCDRWLIYHGHTTLKGWAAGRILGAKSRTDVFDGEDLTRPSPLHAHERDLLRGINADPSSLRTACRRAAGIDVPDPVAVGVDPMGIDVRARFGVVRLEFDSPATTPDQAHTRIASTLGSTP